MGNALCGVVSLVGLRARLSFAAPAAVIVLAMTLLTGAAAQAEGTLRVGATSLPPPLGNPYAAGVFPSWHTWTAMYDALTVVDKSGTAVPALATSWSNVRDTAWQFKLRSGVRFDNGEALDATAVATIINWLKSEPGKATSVGRQVAGIASARVVDAMTVEIETTNPDAILPGRLSSVFFVAPKAWEDMGAEGYAKNPIGTGSFKPESWTPEGVVFSARPDSWRPPLVSNLEILPMGERPARVQALVSDQIDIAVSISVDNIAQVEAAGQRVASTPSTTALALNFVQSGNATASNEETVFTDVRVRQALNYAVDKEAIVKHLLGGVGAVSSQGATPNTFGYDAEIAPYPYDPAKARELLTAAGFPNGFDVVTEIVVGFVAQDGEIYQRVAEDLAKVGVNMELRQITSAVWIKNFLGGTWGGDAFGAGYNSAPYNDAIRFMVFTSCKKPNPYFCDESVVPLIDKSDTLFDVDERREALQELLAIHHDLAPSIFLVESFDLAGYSKRLNGFENLGKTFNYDKISIAQ
jgi:peptide/nickel transport system substrate-binding protein